MSWYSAVAVAENAKKNKEQRSRYADVDEKGQRRNREVGKQRIASVPEDEGEAAEN
jgi:hypothetical protein